MSQANRERGVGQEFQLVFQVAEGSVVRKFEQARVVLGRSMVCDLVFDSPHLSRKHAEIICDADGWTVRDLRSRLGVAVNGRRVAQRLAHGDRIALAPDAESPTVLEFRLPQSAPLPQAILSDESGPTSIVASIDVRKLSDTLDQSGRENARRSRSIRARRQPRCSWRPMRPVEPFSKARPSFRFWACSNRQARSCWPTRGSTKCCNRS